MKEIGITEVRQRLINIAKRAETKYEDTDDLKAGLLAVKAFSVATITAVAQVRYKSQTGTPVKIDFLEE